MSSTCLFIVVVIATIAAHIHASASSSSASSPTTTKYSLQPPVLPTYYISRFIEWTALDGPSPPYPNGMPPGTPDSKSLFATRGMTYYDWEAGNMIEQRFDNCINIFPGMSNKGWSCTFQNVNNVSYLISKGAPKLPPCCVFGSPWLPPPPDFLRKNVQAVVKNETVPWDSRWPFNRTTWFEIPSIKPPTGPFYYSFTDDQVDPFVVLPETQVFDSFSFPGMQGWIQQNFYHQRWTKPDPSVWDLPAECLPVSKLKNCGFFGVDASKKYAPFGFHGPE